MSNPHIEVARRLLTELAGMAEHASLTGGLGGGQKTAAQAFNGALETLRVHDAIPDGMFTPVKLEEADYGSIGVQARLLLAVLPGEPEGKEKENKDRNRRGGGDLGAVVALAPFLDSDDLAQMLRERIDETSEVPDELLTALAPFLDSGDLGELVRRRMRPRAPKAPEPPQAPEPPAPPQPPATPQASMHPQIVMDVRPEIQEDRGPETLEDLVAQLRRADLTIEDRQRIATRLAELSYEQSIHALE